jgi:arylformamidase
VLIDITRPIAPDALLHPEDPQPVFEKYASIEGGDDYNLTQLSLSLHTGTHFDAPLHFVAGGKAIDQLTVERFDVRAHVVRIDGECVQPEDLADLDIQRWDAVLLRTTNETLPRETMSERWVWVTQEAAQLCVDRGVGILGVDYIEVESPDEQHGSYPVHQTLLPAGTLLLENLDLRAVAPGTYRLLCFPLKIEGAEAAPCRAVLISS